MQESIWPSWCRQHVEALWTTLDQSSNIRLTTQDKQVLLRTRECLLALSGGFDGNCALTHSNSSLRDMLKDAYSDQLLAIIGSGLMLRAPKGYELFRLMDDVLTENPF